ncbi:HlyD family secretion protein [Paraburkholderia sp. RAU2J]|uniref:HlyD family efflux transporter periplasmic adaptor subunit n=1 Tax=Paraburkholderia sp. RAU2J TaxID=1938810 RepID=UPI000EAE72DC|nr:HlyD family efflux transporter periplasmic adaptor subunit [Paraburkholderia sp. RAU2J]RKT10555.1 HlyD family secretion protein [Paraburkholderia sp. RAU2J]
MTTIPAKAINLRVRPLQSVDLCFPVDGILAGFWQEDPGSSGATQNDIHLLGKKVKAFDLGNLYSQLSTVHPPGIWKFSGPGKPAVFEPLSDSLQPLGWGRLKYDSKAIRDAMSESILFELRAEQVKAALDKAVGQRENIWVQKYEVSVYEATKLVYDRTDPNSKLNRLKRLAAISQDQHDRLDAEYVADFPKDGSGAPVWNKGVIKQSVTGGSVSSNKVQTQIQDSKTTIQSWLTDGSFPTENNSSSTRGYDYRTPSLENDAQLERAQISLRDEQLSAVSTTNYACGSLVERKATELGPDGLTVRYLANDLAAIDLDIKRLQAAYMDTLLVSPIDGVVTGVFRNIGDSVRAAQPVIRIENDAEIYLVGTLKYPGLLQIDQSISVSTQLADTSEPRSVSGKVRAVRGHDSEDNLWDVLILCNNREGGQAQFPINYNFDFDTTTVTVTAV